ncbi:hypothetical protein AFIC_002745 [[Pseudomonas] carboxydohydrogena]|uniref:Uncharacterized protein n=1 Tax=Afipia carboxydohydrogena TaxID=290 RepID=A0ABY8BMF4_AFICR|nr:hypothetical protein [[Pseudomonas] carboxydohydrogena]WEF51173.1 hypothetical protein AFIC_002745 [[Pseudomonas] carboxydohydrogena]
MILSPNVAGRIVPDGQHGCRYNFAKSVKSSMFRAGQPDNQSLDWPAAVSFPETFAEHPDFSESFVKGTSFVM